MTTNDNKNSKQRKTSQRTVQIIAFIRNYTDQHGYSPSVREIGAAVGLSSTSSVQGYLNRLETQGIIERREDRPRTIKIVSDEFRTQEQPNMTVPIVKDIVFDGQMFNSDNIIGYRSIPQENLPEGDVYVYYKVDSKFNDDDCREMGFLQDDLVLLRIGSIGNGKCKALIKFPEPKEHVLYRVQVIDNSSPKYDSVAADAIATRLKKARNHRDLSIGKIINHILMNEHVNISEGQYTSWEKGYEIPSLFFVQALSNVLKVSSDWLLGLSKDMESNEERHIIGEVIGLSRSFK